MKKLLIVVVCFSFMSCAIYRVYSDRNNIKEGLLTLEIPQSAFLAEWGKPDRLYTTSGEEYVGANWGTGWGGKGGGFFKGKETLQVWVYEKKKTELFFDDDKELVGWKTDATVQELSTTDNKGENK